MAVDKQTDNIELLKQSPLSIQDGMTLLRPDGSPVPKHWSVFKEGELIEVKGSTFKVAYINESSVTLEPANLLIKEPDNE
jgi:hypothetical protein